MPFTRQRDHRCAKRARRPSGHHESNPIESTFAAVRLRKGVTKGTGSRTAGLVMAFKLLHVAEGYWRDVDAVEPVPLVRAGVRFGDGVHMEPQKRRTKAVA